MKSGEGGLGFSTQGRIEPEIGRSDQYAYEIRIVLISNGFRIEGRFSTICKPTLVGFPAWWGFSKTTSEFWTFGEIRF